MVYFDCLIKYKRYTLFKILAKLGFLNVVDYISDIIKDDNLEMFKYIVDNEIDETFEVQLEELLLDFDDISLQYSKLMQLIKLVESSGVYSFNSDMDDWVTIVTLDVSKELQPMDDTGKKKNKIQKSKIIKPNKCQNLRKKSYLIQIILLH